MTTSPDKPDRSATSLRSLHERSINALLRAADAGIPGADRVGSRGSLLAEVAVVKGLAGPAEHAGGQAVSGSEAAALEAALSALGHDSSRAFYILSHPEGASAEAAAERLRLSLEAVDAPVIIALDHVAAADVARAYGLETLGFGRAVEVGGRRLVAVDGFEASLGQDSTKRRVWAQMQAAKPFESVY